MCDCAQFQALGERCQISEYYTHAHTDCLPLASANILKNVTFSLALLVSDRYLSWYAAELVRMQQYTT